MLHERTCTSSNEKSTAIATVSQLSRCGMPSEGAPSHARLSWGRLSRHPWRIWVAEQLDLVAHIDRACGEVGAKGGPSVGELAVAVAIQRACAPGPKRELGEFLDASLPRLSCLPGSAFSGQAFHRVAQQVTEHQLEQAQVAVAKAAVARFELSADVLAFDTTNFDTHMAEIAHPP